MNKLLTIGISMDIEENLNLLLKFKYSEKATKFCKIFSLLLSYVVPVKSKVKISQNFEAFSEYMNFENEFVYVSSLHHVSNSKQNYKIIFIQKQRNSNSIMSTS